MSGDKVTLELVGVVEDQGKYIFSKWREASGRPEGFSQFRAFVTSIDDFSNFVDLVEARASGGKVARRDDILQYLTQLRLQIIAQKLQLMGLFLTAMRKSRQPIPLGAQAFFRSVRNWTRTLRRINDRSIKEHGSTPVDADLVTKADRLLRWAVANSRDIPPIVIEGRVVRQAGRVEPGPRRGRKSA